MQTQTTNIEIDLIDRSPYQMRRRFDQEEIAGLAASIERYGLLHPLVVRPKGARYELISGERRLLALFSLKKKSAWVSIRKGESESYTAEMALSENLQRAELSPMEVAHSYQGLMDAFALTQEELAKRLGKPRSTLANFLRLLKLPPSIQVAVDEGKISMGHAKILLSAKGEAQKELFEKIEREKISVRQTEKIDPNTAALEKELSHHFGRPVQVIQKGDSGQLIFKWNNLDSLDELLSTFGIYST